MDPDTHQFFVEKDVHFEESSPILSSTPLRTSYIVETNSDTSDSALMDETHGVLSKIAVRGHDINILHMHIFTQ